MNERRVVGLSHGSCAVTTALRTKVCGLLWNAGLVGPCVTRAHDVSASIAATVDGRLNAERSHFMTSAFGTRAGSREGRHDRLSLQKSFRCFACYLLPFFIDSYSSVIRFGAREDEKRQIATRWTNRRSPMDIPRYDFAGMSAPARRFIVLSSWRAQGLRYGHTRRVQTGISAWRIS